MARRRTDVLLALGGAAPAAVAAIWGAGISEIAAALAFGLALGGSRRYPRATWALAAAILAISAVTGTIPGGDNFVVYPLLAAHACCAGRWDDRWAGIGAVVAL